MFKSERFQTGLMSVSSKIQNNKYISAITDALISTLPVTIVGALGSIINTLPIDAYQGFLVSTGLKSVTPVLTMVTTNMLSLYVVFLIAYKFAVRQQQEGLLPGILALMAFLVLTPLGNLGTSIGSFLQANGLTLAEGTSLPTTDYLALDWLGAAGLFTAFIVGLVTSQIYVVFKTRNWVIKMPAGVPDTVSKTFTGLVPGLVIGLLALLLRYGMSLTAFGSLHVAIFKIVAAPLTSLGGSFSAMLVAVLVAHILWLCGVHGSMVVYSVFAGIWIPLQYENLAAYNAQLPIPNIVSMSLFGMVAFMGAGGTIGLVLHMIRAKSEQHKLLGKLAIVPNFFGINEPILFGLPIVMNFTLAVPFIVMPVITLICAHFGMVMNLLPRLTGVPAPLGTPVIVSGFLMGGWQWALFQGVMIIISYVLYLPFFKAADRIAYEKERESAPQE